MTFRQLLNLYKKGQLPDKDKYIVEEEVDKFKAISDYVYSEIEEETNTESFNITDSEKTNESAKSAEDENRFTKAVNKQIQTAFKKMGFCVLVIVLVIFLFIQFALSPIVSSFYYNPDKKITSSPGLNEGVNDLSNYERQQLEIDYTVFSELRMPLEPRSYAQVTPTGYGKYNIEILSNGYTQGEIVKPSISGQLVRNRLSLSEPDFLSQSISRQGFDYNDTNSYSEEIKGNYIETTRGDINKEKNEIALESLKGERKDKWFKTKISFKTPKSFEEVLSIEEKYRLHKSWFAVVTREKPKNSEDIEEKNGWNTQQDIGFSSSTWGGYNKEYKNEAYPNLFIDINDNLNEHSQDEEYMKTHFLSMLRYIHDQDKFRSVFDSSQGDEYDYKNIYKDSYEYVRKNGIMIYGATAYVQKEDIKKLIDDGVAYRVEIF